MTQQAAVDALVEQVLARLTVEMEASGRHVHLSRNEVEYLFGPGYRLTQAKPLSQPGQFASVNLPYDEIRAALVHDPS